MQRVLLASDGSEGSLHAARVLGDLVRGLPEATVTILYVAHVPRSFQVKDEFGEPVMSEVPLDVMIRRSADPVRLKTVQAMGLPEERVVFEVQVGEPAEEIVEMARLEAFELIVIGSRGLSPLKELLLGSVSNRVVHTAHCPVLVVR